MEEASVTNAVVRGSLLSSTSGSEIMQLQARFTTLVLACTKLNSSSVPAVLTPHPPLLLLLLLLLSADDAITVPSFVCGVVVSISSGCVVSVSLCVGRLESCVCRIDVSVVCGVNFVRSMSVAQTKRLSSLVHTLFGSSSAASLIPRQLCLLVSTMCVYT